MTQPPDSVSAIAVNSAPGLFYMAVRWLCDLTIDKWVSFATLILIVAQIFVFARKEFKLWKSTRAKRRIKR